MRENSTKHLLSPYLSQHMNNARQNDIEMYRYSKLRIKQGNDRGTAKGTIGLQVKYHPILGSNLQN